MGNKEVVNEKGPLGVFSVGCEILLRNLAPA
jgi:hypothetical protein